MSAYTTDACYTILHFQHIIILVSVYPTASTVSNGPLAFNGNPHSENTPVGARTGRRERERVRNMDGGKNEGVGRKVKRAMRKGMRAGIYEHHNWEYGFECTANLSYVSHLLSLFRSYNIWHGQASYTEKHQLRGQCTDTRLSQVRRSSPGVSSILCYRISFSSLCWFT